MFQTKKDFITCSKLIMNDNLFYNYSDKFYFANNKQASLAVFTATICFGPAKHNIIKLKFKNN